MAIKINTVVVAAIFVYFGGILRPAANSLSMECLVISRVQTRGLPTSVQSAHEFLTAATSVLSGVAAFSL